MHSAPGSVLADDGIVVRRSRQGYQIHATPLRQRPGGGTKAWEWHQEAAPLLGAFLIRQSRETSAIPDARYRLVGELLGACSHFSLWMDRAAMASLFDFWAQISLELPMGRLVWRPGTDFWTKVDHFLKKGDMPHVLGEEETLA
jgi:hypothetical protein